MKAEELVKNVQGYVKDHNVSIVEACGKLNVKSPNYYAAVKRIQGKKKAAVTAASVKKSAPVAAAPQAAVAPRHTARTQTYLIVGEPAAISEVAKSLGIPY